MKAPSPIDKDSISVNFLTQLERAMRRLDALERQAATGLFKAETDAMFPPGDVSLQKGNFEQVGGRAGHRCIFNVGTKVPLEIVDVGGGIGEITLTQSWHEVDGEGSADDIIHNINGGVDGDVLWMIAASSVEISVSEAGNIKRTAQASFAGDDICFCIFNGTDWCCQIFNIT